MNIKNKFNSLKDILFSSSLPVRCSICVMGTGQLLYKQWISGLLYLSAFVGMIVYLALSGINDIRGFITLGTKEADPWLGIKGDDSVILMLRGLLAILMILAFLVLHIVNIKHVLSLEAMKKSGKQFYKLKRRINYIMDRKFYVVALILPVAGVLVFNVIPIVFMIIISFTN